MTREEAIEVLTNLQNGHGVSYSESYGLCFGHTWMQAYEMAISALREQEERSKGCEYCRESENIYYHAGEVNALDELLYITGDDLVVDIGCRFYLAASIKFCPMCGRRLDEV